MKTNLSSICFLPLCIFLLSPGCSSQNTPALEFLWETPSDFRVPESVCYDLAGNRLFVSNVDGDPAEEDSSGFISIISLDGKIINLHWVDGLNAPKGMGIFDGKLYVTDITRVAEIDIAKGKILAFYKAEGAEFLNDISISVDGNIFISDSNTNRIYRLKDGVIELWMQCDELKGANGLLVEDDMLNMVSFANGNFYKIDIRTKKATLFARGLGAGDGLETCKNGDYLVSNWNGSINYVRKDSEVIELLNTEKDKINAADIDFILSESLLVVPTFYDNRIRAYRLEYH